MQHIRELIDKSKIWNFKRRVLYDNEFYASIDDGIIEWIPENDNNKFLYLEKGLMVFHKNDNLCKNLNYFHSLVFDFKEKNYTVYRNNGSIFYKSNSTSKTSNTYNDNRYDIEVKYINNIVTIKVDVTGKQKFNSIITNYYPK